MVKGVVIGIISIHASREGGDFPILFLLWLAWPISIHASREGGDEDRFQRYGQEHISIHASREGGDDRSLFGGRAADQFQSTPPVREATKGGFQRVNHITYFNPRLP